MPAPATSDSAHEKTAGKRMSPAVSGNLERRGQDSNSSKKPAKNALSKIGEAKPEALAPEVVQLAEALAKLPPEMRAALLALAKGK